MSYSNSDRPLVEIRSLVKHFRLRGGWLTGRRIVLHAVDGVDLTIMPGESFGLVGESGCGKTTLGRCILRLVRPTSGQVIFDGTDLSELTRREMRHLRRQMQIVFQNPFSSLSPRFRIFDIIAEPLRTHKVLPKLPRHLLYDRVVELLEQVGLGRQHLDRYPHELSGGQCQRVAIARALSLDPRLLILDEPTSALDVSVQAQILNLLVRLRHELQLTYLFISHNLSVVEHISDRIGVMYLGKLVEIGPTETVFREPLHPYTRALLQSVPLPIPGARKEAIPLHGNVPSPANPPSGCRFHTRCRLATDICRTDEPPLQEIAPGHLVACHLVGN